MLRIEYFDKNRFMKQVAASRGSVILHLDNGSTCDLKKDDEASAIFQTMDAPKKGFSISVSDPADVTGFLGWPRLLKTSSSILHYSSSQQNRTAPLWHISERGCPVLLHFYFTGCTG